ncbi:unnamed protein product, partial [Tetraodon nigroviridis]
QVLCVGNLYNPDVRYSFNIPIEEDKEQFVWDPSGSWLECSRICHGERRRKVVCVRKSDRLEVSDQRCEHLPQVAAVSEPCNTDCEVRWHVAGKSDCSAKCGSGYRSLDVQCMKYSLLKRQSERVDSNVCANAIKPRSREPCHGDCLLKSWQYSAWSQVQPTAKTSQTDTVRVSGKPPLTSCRPLLTQCSKTCGRGSRSRESYCMNNLGRRLADRECSEHQRLVTESCSEQPCPKWSFSEWSEVSPLCHSHHRSNSRSRPSHAVFLCPASPVPGDLWERRQAQTSVLHNQHRRKAQRALLRPFCQTSHCGDLRAARVCILDRRRLGR